MAYVRAETIVVEVKCSCGTAGKESGTRENVEAFVRSYSPDHDAHEISAKLTRPDGSDRYYHDECGPRDPTINARSISSDQLSDAIAKADGEIVCDFCGDAITVEDE